MNVARSVYNISVDPLNMEVLLGKKINMSSWVVGYQVSTNSILILSLFFPSRELTCKVTPYIKIVKNPRLI